MKLMEIATREVGEVAIGSPDAIDGVQLTDRRSMAVQWVLRIGGVRWKPDRVDRWSNLLGSTCDG
jgi:hypothetical protein